MSYHVHFVRHGEVASHQGDIPITENGCQVALAQGRKIGRGIEEREKVIFLYAATLRTYQTANMLLEGVSENFRSREISNELLQHPMKENAIRNPDIFLGGLRVEMVSTAEALAKQTSSIGVGADQLKSIPFWPQFWESPDRIGYWLGHEDPPGEDVTAVARRMLKFAASLSILQESEPQRYICVTHSPVLRAFLNTYLLDKDLGEPEYCETIDLLFNNEGSCSIKYRTFEKTISI